MREGIVLSIVIASEVDVAKTDWKNADGLVTRVNRQEAYQGLGPYFYISFTYKVGEDWYGGYFRGKEEYAPGDSIPVRYNPDNTDENDLVNEEKRRKLIRGLLLCLLIVFFAFVAIYYSAVK